MESGVRTVEHSIPIDILDDLVTRFLICVPESARENLIRICFQIEMAHWFYLDFYVANNANLKTCNMHEFAAHVFQYIPSLKSEKHNLNEILDEWKVYKQTVPTYGAILISEDMKHVLLVQSYWAKSSWGFPKGKVNEEEDPAHCAVREVLEETGFDISNYIDPNVFFESVINDQLIRLYIIKNIPMDTKFQPRTRFEIKCCEWFAISDLPNNKKDSTPKQKIGVNPNAFYMVMPFVKRLRAFCSGSTKKHRHKSASISEGDYSSAKSKVKSSHKHDAADESFKVSRIAKRTDKVESLDVSKNLFFNDFYAPSWLNFKFDKTAIMDCIP